MSNLDQSIKAAREVKASYDNFWKENILQELAKGGANKEAAITRLASMSSVGEIKAAKLILKPQEFERLQQLSMQRLFSMSASTPGSTFTSPFAGKGLTQAIQGIGQDRLEEMFGVETARDLVDLGKTMRYVFSSGQEGAGMAGALRAGAFMFHPLSHLPAMVANALEAKLMSTPGFIRWITVGLEGDSKFAQMVYRAHQVAAYEAARGLAAQAMKPPPEYGQAQ
jgi:hypothetical protein